jgi:hypothetical protein
MFKEAMSRERFKMFQAYEGMGCWDFDGLMDR